MVIGGAGLIGSHAVDQLSQGGRRARSSIYDNFVRGTHENLAGALQDPRVKIFEAGGDICQTDILDAALKGADGVFHFAALWLLQCHEFPRAAFDVNVRGTFNVLEACVRNGVKRLVYSSSASVYGDAVEEPMTEDHPFNNKNFYGATKICGEAMARAFHHRYGLNYVGLRYMNVYGPRQDYRGAYIAVIMKMLDAIDRGEGPTILGDGIRGLRLRRRRGLRARQRLRDEGRRRPTASTMSAPASAPRSRSSPRCCSSSPAPTSRSTTRRAARRRCAQPHRLPEARHARRSASRRKIDLDEGLQRLIDWRKAHIEQVEQRRRKARV